MINLTVYFTFILTLIFVNRTLAQTNKTNNINTHRELSLKNEFKEFIIYSLSDTIKGDFNGDKIFDLVYITQNPKEIFIIDGKSRKSVKVGSHKSFGDMQNQFNWIDYWGTTNDNETYEIVIDDSEIVGDRKVKLINTSIFLRKDEVGGGIITYKNGEFIWIHQSD